MKYVYLLMGLLLAATGPIIATDVMARNAIVAKVANEEPATQTLAVDTPLPKAVEAYQSAVKNQDIASLEGFVYPGFFKLVPKEKLMEQLRARYSGDNGFRVLSLELEEVPEAKTFEQGQFCLVAFDLKLELARMADSDSSVDQMVITKLKRSLGSDAEVAVDVEKGVYVVNGELKRLFIRQGSEGWKVISLNRARELLVPNGLLPEDVVAEIPELSFTP